MKSDDSAHKGFDGEKVQVVRVKPYPIMCKLHGTKLPAPLECHIHRLTELGFIFKAIKYFYRVGDTYVCDFEFPVVKTRISSEVKVVRTFDSFESYVPGGHREKVMTVEVQFKKQDPAFSKPIREFLNRIGQKDTPQVVGQASSLGKAASPAQGKSPQGLKTQEKRKA